MSAIDHISKFFCKKPHRLQCWFISKMQRSQVRFIIQGLVWFCSYFTKLILLKIIYFTSVKLVPNLTIHLGGIFYYIDLPNGQTLMYRDVNVGISTRSFRKSNLLWKGAAYSWFLWVFSKQHFPKYQVPGVLDHQREALYIHVFCK